MFIGRMEMVFIASADAQGECDASLRAGPPGFLRVLDERTVAYPEYRGNGVHASLGNISENAHVGLLMVDFVDDLIGLHVNGRARIVGGRRASAPIHPDVPRRAGRGARRRALGRRRRRGGLHPLPQAHPADGAGVAAPGLGHRRPGPQGRRLLRGQGDAAVDAAPAGAAAFPQHHPPHRRPLLAQPAPPRRSRARGVIHLHGP